MALKIIVFELHSDGNDYRDFRQYLRSQNHKKLSTNSVAIADDLTAGELFSHLKPLLKETDYLLVFELNKGVFTGKHNKITTDWLKESL
jgi:hypothetical protein